MVTNSTSLAGEARTDYQATPSKQAIMLVGLIASLAVIVLVALVYGAVPIPFEAFLVREDYALERTILAEIRSPRVMLAAFVGGGLGIAGATLQGLFRNPLADPGLIGVSSGAALGAIALITLGGSISVTAVVLPYLLPLAAVGGAIMVTLFLYMFANRYGGFGLVTMLLVGIAINAAANVGIGAFQYLSDDAQLRTLVFWMMGSFGRADWLSVAPATVIITGCIIVLLRQAHALDLLQLGEHEAQHLGVDVRRFKRTLILTSAAVVGAGVALSGIIGFVGLVIPHLVRLAGGAQHKFVLPASALAGAALLVMADLIARTITVPAEIPVGLVTSAIGAPFFLWLISRVSPK